MGAHRRAVEILRVTAQWLTDRLGKSVGAVALAAVPLDGTTGTTDRRRLAVEWDEVGKDAGLPANVFIKSSPLNAKNRVMVGALDMAVNEVRFYRQASGELEGIVPKAWYSYAGVGARFLIVLDDLAVQGANPMPSPTAARSTTPEGSSTPSPGCTHSSGRLHDSRGTCRGCAPGVPARATAS